MPKVLNKKIKQASDETDDFLKRNKVSVWASQIEYEAIPDAYFEEAFTKNGTRATNQWTANFKLKYFNPDMLETNGAQIGLVDIERAAGECSYSKSYMEVLMSKARNKKLEQVSWLVMLFGVEYSRKITGVEQDDVLTFVGAFDFDEETESLYEVIEADQENKGDI